MYVLPLLLGAGPDGGVCSRVRSISSSIAAKSKSVQSVLLAQTQPTVLLSTPLSLELQSAPHSRPAVHHN